MFTVISRSSSLHIGLLRCCFKN